MVFHSVDSPSLSDASCLRLFSPSFVPSPISYKAFIRFFIILMGLALTAFPLARDLMGRWRNEGEGQASLYLLMVFFVSIPKVYSPFINFSLNNAVDKYSRTSLNSITFIFSTGTTVLLTAAVLPVLSFSVFSPTVQTQVYWTEFLPFVLLDCVLAAALLFLRKI